MEPVAFIRDNITDEKKRSKLKGLYDYLKNNLDYLVNYNEREKADKTFTSQVAESHIDTLINARHKRKQKMQWTRDGAQGNRAMSIIYDIRNNIENQVNKRTLFVSS